MTLSAIDRFVVRCGRTSAFAGGALVLLIAVMVTGEVIARNLTGRIVFHAFELSSYLFAAALSFGLAQTLIAGGNIRLDVVYRLLPGRVRRGLDIAALAMMAGVGAFLARFAWKLTLANGARGVTSSTGLAVPLAWPQGVWALGITIFALAAAWLTLRHAIALWQRDFTTADRVGAIGAEPVETAR